MQIKTTIQEEALVELEPKTKQLIMKHQTLQPKLVNGQNKKNFLNCQIHVKTKKR
jgi:hypothetical protein